MPLSKHCSSITALLVRSSTTNEWRLIAWSSSNNRKQDVSITTQEINNRKQRVYCLSYCL